MRLAEFVQKVDLFILDKLFQPVSDFLPENITAWSCGMSFQIGSVVFQVVCIMAPIFLYGASFGESMQAVLVLICSFVFLLGIQRLKILVRPGMMNPLRVMMQSMRLIGWAFLGYETVHLLLSDTANWLWNSLSALSQFIFVVGLYFMSCQPRPPGARRTVNIFSHGKKPKII